MTITPFEITSDQITRLGSRFATFVNKLLEVERSAQHLQGGNLKVTSNECAKDGGIDAFLSGSRGNEWTPAGETAWQFKRGTYTAAQCAKELAGATAVHGVLRGGGQYVFVLGGQSLAPVGLTERHKALVDRAVDLRLLSWADASRIRVVDTNHLARWASRFPSLAVDPILQGIQQGAIDFERWRASRVHLGPYSPDETRLRQIDDIRQRLRVNQLVDIRLQGDSGIGKTRLALEALDIDGLRSLVAYIDDASQMAGGLIESLVDQGRHAILVVDECPAERHIKLTAKLPASPGVRIITIGDVGRSRSSGTVVGLQALSDEAMDNLLVGNFPTLGLEARRFVVAHSHGTPDWAIWLADAVQRTPNAQAAQMIARNDIERFVSGQLPEGRDFFLAAVLALFERIGWDRDVRSELEQVAGFAGATGSELDTLIYGLTQRGLARKQGRYRAISPLPVAIYLAAEAWRVHGGRIVDELLPSLRAEMALSLLRRLAQLGRFEPARAVVPGLLAANGPFRSLLAIEESHLGALLTQLAIVMPDEVVDHLSLLVEDVPVEELTTIRGSRRELVWALEKLSWHSWTFERAANALLKLALAENEAYANNATGTWVDLFGGALPGTAASPAQRVAYLKRHASDPRAAVRSLVVQATEKPLRLQESIMIAGEIQGGVLVEPRGTPSTLSELGDYQRELLRILDGMRADVDPSVASGASTALLNALHPLIDDVFVGGDLAEILSSFEGDYLMQLRVQIEHLVSLHGRNSDEDGGVQDALRRLKSRLPPLDSSGELALLLRMDRWDLGEGELEERLLATLQRIPSVDRRPARLAIVLEEKLSAGWEFGRALAFAVGDDDDWTSDLARHVSTNRDALIGYLSALTELRGDSAFDAFLDSDAAAVLDDAARLSLAVRGPGTESARRRILEGIADLPVREAVATLAGRGRDFAPDTELQLVERWIERLVDQDDYNALLGWLALSFRHTAIPDPLRRVVFDALMARRIYPDIGRDVRHWGSVARRFIEERSSELLVLLLDLVDVERARLYSRDDDATVLAACVAQQPEDAWREIGARLEAQDGWRLATQLGGWVQYSVPLHVHEHWVGGDIDRARLLATLASPGAAEPSALAALLLDRFSNDAQVSSSLRASFLSGTWSGRFSDRISRQIEQLKGWESSVALPLAVRQWAKKLADQLRREHQEALEAEAEQGYL